MKRIILHRMTLLEVMMATGILSMMLLFSLFFLSSLSDAAAIHQEISELDKESESALNKMTQKLQSGYIPFGDGSSGVTAEDWVTTLNLAAGGNQISFVMPVDWDDDGDLLDGSLQPEYGVIRDDGNPGHLLYEGNGPTGNGFYVRFQFVQTGTYQETANRGDLNQDGDTNDTFQVGYLEAVYPTSTCTSAGAVHQNDFFDEFRVPLTPSIVLQGNLDPSDAADEPLFQLTGSTLTIDLYVCDTTEPTPILGHMTTAVQMRNMQ